jgi:hypothetical protein
VPVLRRFSFWLPGLIAPVCVKIETAIYPEIISPDCTLPDLYLFPR